MDQKLKDHEVMLSRNLEEDNWSLDRILFEKVSKRIKDKNKKMFRLFNRAGPLYKEAVFTLMKRFIDEEEVPSAYDFTSLTQERKPIIS